MADTPEAVDTKVLQARVAQLETELAAAQDELRRVSAECASQKQLLRDELEARARTDDVTGLLRRPAFMEIASLEFVRAKRYGRSLCLVTLSVEGFATICSKYGEDAGDRVLQCVASVCSGMLRDVDVLSRREAGDFAFLLPETPLDQAREVAARLCAALAVADVAIGLPDPIHFRAAAGLAGRDYGMTSVDDLIEKSSLALARAKNSGGSSVVCC